MLKIFSCLVFLLLYSQVDEPAFYIEKVCANTTLDSRYIFNHSNQIIPQDKPVGEGAINKHIECLVSELKASGIFRNVTAELYRTKNANYREVLVNTDYHPEIESFVISEIVLTGFPEIDKQRFQSTLNKAGVKSGDRLLKHFYYDLENKVRNALVKAYPKELYSDDKSFWLSFRPDGERKVKLIVAPSYSGCR